ncbi:DUF3073 domain-containing protein [Microbacterium sp. EYE_5]|jgi:hypothetical protein|uniref:DUF3073 family protein n=1 Tax=unclassified Microbacterium TaxID=2609290 RepID=UPI0020033DF8|nr:MULTISPECIES: DUF3073 family protein [unclassified Microbacterium]MCK6079696.1 DUF3073 domain-containing protein [Microbacterium sp. EYE_382]MCK6084967.1 DUF3073 domain-containing protein [Microbacterium sp. EYE_384]MCK6122807.1 DUF3073 domain-containing protein [Microbacterium sp. EYE_80]MCK6125730.1 DUF3073 domain-containing protein [Microbacterium sp. EYE_79]MCK6140651.1 DUF3073 domain-containing protein [Microbacterium sp. EYE_39]
MGRGRQKAKNTKIARELKYDTYSLNINALERELGAPGDEQYEDKWADQYADEDDEDDPSAPTSASYEKA